MEDNYNPLDQRFKKLLENAPPMEPSNHALADMKRRLDGNQSKRRRGILWWWVFLLPSSLLLFTALFFYKKYDNANQKVNELNLQLSQIQENYKTASGPSEQSPQVIHHYDTIYQTRESIKYIDRIVSHSDNKHENTRSSDWKRWPGPHFADLQMSSKRSGSNIPLFRPTPKAISPWALNPLSIDYPEKTQGLSNTTTTPVPLSLFNTLAQSPFQEVSQKDPFGLLDVEELLANTPLPENKKRSNPLLNFVPLAVHLGINASPALSIGIPGSGLFGFRYGGHGEITFRKNIRLGVGINAMNFTTELKSNFSDYPVADPENLQDTPKELYIFLDYLEIPVYFKYPFPSNKKLQTFANIGLNARRTLEQEYRYEYISSTGNEYLASAFVPSNSFSLASVHAGFGISYPFTKKISAQAQLLYKHDLKLATMESIKLHYFGLDFGLQYGF